jgi:hypothetical protein
LEPIIQIITNNLPVLIIVGLVCVVLGIIEIGNTLRLARTKRSPLVGSARRHPGQSLLVRLGELNQSIDTSLACLLLAPLLLYAAYISYLYFGRRHTDLAGSVIIASACIGLSTYYLIKRRRHLKERRSVWIDYEGELSVGQELNRLMLEGYVVFHDFLADDFRLDHIVVGPNGVFGVETKSRSWPKGKKHGLGAVVAYNGRVLDYPHGTDMTTIEQAERQASRLSNWISTAVGESVTVMAVVALPGWYVKRTAPDGIPVVHPKQFPSLLSYVRSKSLSDELIMRIVRQLDRHYRESAYGPDQDHITRETPAN